MLYGYPGLCLGIVKRFSTFIAPRRVVVGLPGAGLGTVADQGAVAGGLGEPAAMDCGSIMCFSMKSHCLRNALA